MVKTVKGTHHILRKAFVCLIMFLFLRGYFPVLRMQAFIPATMWALPAGGCVYGTDILAVCKRAVWSGFKTTFLLKGRERKKRKDDHKDKMNCDAKVVMKNFFHKE